MSGELPAMLLATRGSTVAAGADRSAEITPSARARPNSSPPPDAGAVGDEVGGAPAAAAWSTSENAAPPEPPVRGGVPGGRVIQVVATGVT